MENTIDSGNYTLTPVRMVCPMGAFNTTDFHAKPTLQTVDTLATLPTTVGLAQRQGKELRRQARRDLQHDDLHAIYRLLADHPYLATVPDIGCTLVKLTKVGRLRAAPGRPRGVFRLDPLTVWGMVQVLCELGEVPSKEQAFHWLSQTLGYVSFGQLKQLYSQANTDPRFQAVLYTVGQVAKEDDVHQGAIGLPSGGKLNYTSTDEQGKVMSVTFEDVPNK